MEDKKSDCDGKAPFRVSPEFAAFYGGTPDFAGVEMGMAKFVAGSNVEQVKDFMDKLKSIRRKVPKDEFGYGLKRLHGDVWIKETAYPLVKEIVERPWQPGETMELTMTHNNPPIELERGVLRHLEPTQKGTFTITVYRDAPCPDCINTPGKYVGFTTVEDCLKCKGTAKGGREIIMQSGPHDNEIVVDARQYFLNEYQNKPRKGVEQPMGVLNQEIKDESSVFPNFQHFGRFGRRTMTQEQIEAQSKGLVPGWSKEDAYRFMYGANVAQMPDGRVAVDTEGPTEPDKVPAMLTNEYVMPRETMERLLTRPSQLGVMNDRVSDDANRLLAWAIKEHPTAFKHQQEDVAEAELRSFWLRAARPTDTAPDFAGLIKQARLLRDMKEQLST